MDILCIEFLNSTIVDGKEPPTSELLLPPTLGTKMDVRRTSWQNIDCRTDDDLLPCTDPPGAIDEGIDEERRCGSSVSTGANEMRRTLERRDFGATRESRWLVLE
jgi:hypothetical protein